MVKRYKVIEIFAPTLGIKSDVPTLEMDPRAQADGLDSKMYYGVNQKEYGTSIYATGAGAVMTGGMVNFLFEAKFPNGNVLQAFTPTNVNRYTSGTDSFVSDGQAFTGTFSDYWSGVTHNDQFIYNNGVDNIQIKTSVSATGTQMNSAVTPTTYKAWGITTSQE